MSRSGHQASLALSVALLISGLGDGGVLLAAPPAEIALCHSTNSADHRWIQIRVPRPAVAAHHAQGDFVVTPTNPCPPTPCPADEPGTGLVVRLFVASYYTD